MKDGCTYHVEDCSECDAPGALVHVYVSVKPDGYEAIAECGHCKRTGSSTRDMNAQRAEFRAASLWNCAQK
jgi:hypothetical protein